VLNLHDVCTECGHEFKNMGIWNGRFVCNQCFTDLMNLQKMPMPEAVAVEATFNEPSHYHQHEIDTITFLQKGFPPEVCMGFFKGSIVKYTQRADYKNGREDYLKIVDFANRMLDWYDETHS
jgi:hypothetical protein